MNLDQNPTRAELAALLRACDDAAGDHVVWVTRAGDVRVDRLARGDTPEQFAARHADRMQLRWELFDAGNEYVGPDAAADTEWVDELFAGLVRAWPEARGRVEVACRDY